MAPVRFGGRSPSSSSSSLSQSWGLFSCADSFLVTLKENIASDFLSKIVAQRRRLSLSRGREVTAVVKAFILQYKI